MQGEYYEAVGRRKTATARVRLYPGGEGKIIVNERPVEEFFPRFGDVQKLTEPLELSGYRGALDVTILVKGGGISGQTEAARHGLARALLLLNPELRPALKKKGYLSRDPRAKERKKPGLKRARKAPQYTKR
ncbi:MAG: 30S ribosomal protein S9 [Anaerolineae bacterium]